METSTVANECDVWSDAFTGEVSATELRTGLAVADSVWENVLNLDKLLGLLS